MTDQLYFAYGSNLNSSDLARWDREASANLAGQMEPVGPAWLADHDLAFTRWAPRRHGGVLDVVARRGSLAPGYLFRVSDAGWSWLDRKEGTASGAYERFYAWAFDGSDRPVRVQTYQVRRKVDHVAPAREYLHVVREGRAERGIESTDLDRVAAGDRGANALGSLFVYGTLMRGEQRSGLLAQARPTCWIMAEVSGELRDCGSYPGMTVGADTNNLVQGEFVRFEEGEIEEVLAAVDRIEDFRGHGKAAGSLFVRRPVSVVVDDGGVRRAWTYALAASDNTPLIPSGDWRAHRGEAGDLWRTLVPLAGAVGRSGEGAQ